MRIFKDPINADKIIRFFKELRQHVKGKIILVWDRLPAHRAKKVQAFLDTQTHWLTVEWLPGYAPELNPVEYLWSAAKAKDWANLYVDSIGDVDVNIRKGARRFHRNPNLMTSFLKASTLFDKELST
jgi:putative transposase